MREIQIRDIIAFSLEFISSHPKKFFITGVREFSYHTELKWRTEIYCLKEHAEPLSKI